MTQNPITIDTNNTKIHFQNPKCSKLPEIIFFKKRQIRMISVLLLFLWHYLYFVYFVDFVYISLLGIHAAQTTSARLLGFAIPVICVLQEGSGIDAAFPVAVLTAMTKVAKLAALPFLGGVAIPLRDE